MTADDGGRTPTDADDELVAQIIPLRQRTGQATGPRILADEPRHASEPPADPPVLVDPVWDGDPTSTPTPHRRSAGDPLRCANLAHRLTVRSFGAAATLAVAIGVVALLALVLQSPHRQPGPPAQQTSTGLQATLPPAGATGLTTRASSSSGRSTIARGLPQRSTATTPAANSVGRTPKHTSPAPGSAASAAGGRRGTTAESPGPSPARNGTAESSPAASTGVGSEFGFER